uniref:Uncharacterized protein n=1 Tax=Ixodes ricinus TaxID=34613 RepID=V5H483_IXORI
MLCLSININGGIWWLIVTTLAQSFPHVFGLACTCSLWGECSRFPWDNHSNSVYKCISNYAGRFLLFKWKEKMSLHMWHSKGIIFFMPSACSRFYSGILIIVLCQSKRGSVFCAHPAFSFRCLHGIGAKDGDKEKEEIVKGSTIIRVTLLYTVSHQMCIR